jgi:hypothetical protein
MVERVTKDGNALRDLMLQGAQSWGDVRAVASFFAGMGAFYEATGYVGHVDVGMALTNLEGSMPYGLHQWGDNRYSGPPPQKTARVTAAELRDDPKGVAMTLIRRFLDATRGTSYTPFQEQPTA